eukprot:536543-Hanusia_phi.AAC.1
MLSAVGTMLILRVFSETRSQIHKLRAWRCRVRAESCPPFAKWYTLALSTRISVGGKCNWADSDADMIVSKHERNMTMVWPQEMRALSSASNVERTTVLIVNVRQEMIESPRNSACPAVEWRVARSSMYDESDIAHRGGMCKREGAAR